MEGPYDKIITFIEVKKFNSRVLMPKTYGNMDGIGYLGGHTLNELFHAEQAATRTALTKSKRMNYTITIPEINPFTTGGLFFLFEVETAFAGGLFGINPFDQPGVEEGKQLTYGVMGKKGYEDRAAEIEGRSGQSNRRYVIGEGRG
jgi:glucose-6-phosphate isomerase